MAKASGSIDLKSLKIAGEGASKYITDITNNGIKVASATAANLNYITIDANGMNVYKSNGASSPSAILVAQFGSTVQIGESNQAHINITSGGLDLYRGTNDLIIHLGYAGNNTTTPYLTFGRRDSSDTPGYYSAVFGVNAHGEGDYSFVAGNSSTANGDYSHAEGYGNIVLADYSFAIGDHNTINSHGSYSFMAGQNGETDYSYNFLSGIGLIGGVNYQTVFGKYNQEDSNALFIIGNGDDDDARSNLMTVGDDYIRIGNITDYRTIIGGNSFQIGNSDGQILSIASTGSTRPATAIALDAPQANIKLEEESGQQSDLTKSYQYTFTFPLNTTLTFNLIYNGSVVSDTSFDGNTYSSSDGNITKTLTAGDKYGRLLNGLTYTRLDFTVTNENVYVSVIHQVTYRVDAYAMHVATLCGLKCTYPSTIDIPKMSFVGDLYLDDAPISDFVVEQGTDGIWTYRKWNSGIAECWGNDAYTPTGASTWGSLYYCTPTRSVDFPSSLFIATPVVNVFHIGGSTQGWATTSSCGASTLTYYLVRPNSSYGNVCTFSIKASGRWK